MNVAGQGHDVPPCPQIISAQPSGHSITIDCELGLLLWCTGARWRGHTLALIHNTFITRHVTMIIVWDADQIIYLPLPISFVFYTLYKIERYNINQTAMIWHIATQQLF